MKSGFPLLLVAAGMLLAFPVLPKAAGEALNEEVLEIAGSFPDGGGYNDQWTGSGTPEAIEFAGSTVLPEGTGGTYCSGFTFAVAVKAAMSAGLLEGKTFEQVRRFQREWYGAVADENIREKQCAVAVENLGIGREVAVEEAEPGDFAQFWRVRSGHSVVFLGWVYDEHGNRAGLRYRSSQGTTNGIGDRVEYFQRSEAGRGQVDPERIYFARIGL
jgi:hypothetical protein